MTRQGLTGTICIVGVALAVLGIATGAQAQDREQRWELTLGLTYQLGVDLDFEGGSHMETDDELGFVTTFGYNITDQLATSFGFQYAGVGYDADVVGDEEELRFISGTYDTWSMSANMIYYIFDKPMTPYVGAGIGWTWIDTNVPSGPPITGCWWDPWWGYVCYTDYPTRTSDAFSYQATLGLRYEFNEMTFLRFAYTSQWMDFDNASSTPRFDVLGLEIGWMF